MSPIQNPNQEPGTEKRLLLVSALTFLAVVLSQQLLQKFGPSQPKATQSAEQTQRTTGTPNVASAIAPGPSQSPLPVTVPGVAAITKPAPTPVVNVQRATGESETVVENDLYRITFTNRGAQVKSWILKKHFDDVGKPLDLVLHRAAEQYGYPLSLFTYDENLRNKLNSALYVPSQAGTVTAPAELSFDFSDESGLVVHKSFNFDHSYVLRVETSVTQNGASVAAYPAWPAGFGDQATRSAFAASRIDWTRGDKVERKPPQEGSFLSSKKWVSNGETLYGPFYWAGASDQYFAALFLPDRPDAATLVEFHHTMIQDPKEPDEQKRNKDVSPVLGAAVGEKNGPTSLRLFVGPKNLDVLESVHSYAPGETVAADIQPHGPSLQGIVDFGFFGFIAKPLFLWLNWTHDHWSPNWGWAIIILTIIINVALFPLRYTGMKSALMQQKIAPEINAINQRYKGVKFNDPRQQEKVREIQEVQKREGINQLGGCLPSLVQLPFLFAFYTMLSAANELRNASWLWIHDLSSPDPWHLLPMAIVVTMFVMQRITPMTGMDPAQAKMMQTMMPIMMGAFSWSLPAGLGVYWVAGNVIGWGTQYIMNNTKHAREVRAHIEKRAAKKGK